MVIDTFSLPWDSTVDNHTDIPDTQGRSFLAYLTGCILLGLVRCPWLSQSVYISPHLQQPPSNFLQIASAVVYTMVEMAKLHGLNIYGYLKFLLEHRSTKEMTDEQLAKGWSNFISDRVIMWRLLLTLFRQVLHSLKTIWFYLCRQE